MGIDSALLRRIAKPLPISMGRGRILSSISAENGVLRLELAPMNRRTTGFTLVELLVVIAIIGVLLALLLPAVQAAREAARRSHCSNNLKQIGLALHAYVDVNRKLPAGGIWSSSGQGKGSILVHLLPYVEERALFDAFNFKVSNTDGSVFPATTIKIGSTIVPTYICPSDNGDELWDGLAKHNYAASRGPTEVYDNPSCSCAHPWQSLAMAPLDSPGNFAGPFTRVGSSAGLQQVTDGLSKTIFFGEVRPTCSEHARNGWSASNNGNGYCTTLIPINFDSCNDSSPDPCHRSCNWNTEVGFKSLHPGGSQFLLGDGSARFLPEDIDHQAYQYLGAKNDGQPIALSF